MHFDKTRLLAVLVAAWTAAGDAHGRAPARPRPVPTAKVTLPARSGEASPDLQRALDDLSRRAADPDGLVPWLQAVEASGPLSGKPILDAVAADLAREAGVDPVVRAHALLWQARRAREAGDEGASRARVAGAGFPPDWDVLGPFDNYGYSDFEKELAPERGECEAGCGERGRTLSWRVHEDLPTLGRVDLGALFADPRGKIAYCRTYVYVPRAVAAAVRVGADDGVSVFVRGRRAVHDASRKRAAPDQRVAAVRLEAGWNEVVVKVGNDEGAWAFFLRLTAPDGAPLDGARFAVRPEGVVPEARLSVAPAAPRRPPPAPVDPFAVLEARAASDPRDFRPRLDLAELTRLLSREDQDREVAAGWAREALAIRPDSADAWWSLARATLRDPDERRRALERVVEIDPARTAPRARLVEALEGSGWVDRARRLLRESIEIAPDDLDLASLQAGRLDDAGAEEAAFVLWKRLASAHPQDSAPIERAAWRARRLGRDAEARGLLERARGLDRADAGVLRALADAAFDLGDLEAGLAYLREAASLQPWSAPAALSHAEALLHSGATAEARAWLDAAAARFPDHPDLLHRLGDAREREGDAEGARVAWRLSLSARPENPTLQALLDRVSGERDPLQQQWARDPSTLPADHGRPDVYAGRGARALLDLQVTRVHEGGQATRFHQVVVRVDREDAGRNLRNHPLHYDDELEALKVLVAEVIKPDGRRVRARSIDDRSYTSNSGGMYDQVHLKQVGFDTPETGDLVHLQWRVDARARSNRFDDFFGELVRLQGEMPVVEATYTLVVPEGMEVFHGGRGAPEPEVRRSGGEVVRTFRSKDVPSVPAEPSGPGYFDVGTFVSVSNFETWEHVGAWWAGLIAPQFFLGDEGESLARDLARDARTPLDKVRAVYEYVARNTHYIGLEFGIHGWKPYAACQVLDRKYGDCKDKSILMSALLHAMGVPTEMVILSTTGRGSPPDAPPNLFYFNHAIAYVPELDLYLDATADRAPLESLRWDDQGARALRVDRQGRTTWARIPVAPPEANRSASRVDLRVEPDGTVGLHERWTETGVGVPSLRGDYQDAHRWIERVQKDYDGRLPGISVQAVEVEGTADLRPELRFDIRARVPQFAEAAPGTLSVPSTPFPDQWGKGVAATAARRTDIVFQGTSLRELEVVVVPPPGFAARSLPSPARIDGPHLSFERTAVVRGTDVVVTERLVRDSARVTPADYPEFRKAALAIDRAQAERVVFAAAGDPGGPPAGPGPAGNAGGSP